MGVLDRLQLWVGLCFSFLILQSHFLQMTGRRQILGFMHLCRQIRLRTQELRKSKGDETVAEKKLREGLWVEKHLGRDP